MDCALPFTQVYTSVAVGNTSISCSRLGVTFRLPVLLITSKDKLKSNSDTRHQIISVAIISIRHHHRLRCSSANRCIIELTFRRKVRDSERDGRGGLIDSIGQHARPKHSQPPKQNSPQEVVPFIKLSPRLHTALLFHMSSRRVFFS